MRNLSLCRVKQKFKEVIECGACCAPDNNHKEETLDLRCKRTILPTANNTQSQRIAQTQI